MNLVQERLLKDRIDSDDDFAESLLRYLIIDRTILKNTPLKGVRNLTYTQRESLTEIECICRFSRTSYNGGF